MSRLGGRVAAALALGAAALAVASPAGAWRAPKIRTMALSAELTGIHVDRWHYRGAGYPDPDASWATGGGTQTLGFSTPRPLRYRAVVASGDVPGGGTLPPLQLQPLAAGGPLKGSLRRRAAWRPHDAEVCDREGGCEDDLLVPPVHLPPSCPGRRLPVPARIGVERRSGSGLSVLSAKFEALPLEGLWPNCPPDMDGVRRPLALAQPASLGFAGAVARIRGLRPGEEATLKAHLSRGAVDGSASASCPPIGPGLRECAVTDLTLEVTRLR